MDRELKIQLNNKKNVNSVNVDLHDKLQIQNSTSNILEYDIREVISETDVYEDERNNTEIYRIYGGVEYFSILNGITSNYDSLTDFFYPTNCGSYCRTINNSFNFYLVKPSTSGYTKIGNTNDYIREFDVISKVSDFDLYNAGYSKNVYGEQKYIFNLNQDIDISGYVDEFGFPLTEIYLYAKYNPAVNLSINEQEELSRRNWNVSNGVAFEEEFTSSSLNLGDRILGDKIRYDRNNFNQTILERNVIYIKTKYVDNISMSEQTLKWYYYPMIPIKLRYFSNELKRANYTGSSYDLQVEIPNYATYLGEGNYVWREILDQGYIDPLTGDGIDCPFVNKKRYLFNNIIISVMPDLEDTNTKNVFDEIEYGFPETITNKLNTDLADIGKPCQ